MFFKRSFKASLARMLVLAIIACAMGEAALQPQTAHAVPSFTLSAIPGDGKVTLQFNGIQGPLTIYQNGTKIAEDVMSSVYDVQSLTNGVSYVFEAAVFMNGVKVEASNPVAATPEAGPIGIMGVMAIDSSTLRVIFNHAINKAEETGWLSSVGQPLMNVMLRNTMYTATTL